MFFDKFERTLLSKPLYFLSEATFSYIHRNDLFNKINVNISKLCCNDKNANLHVDIVIHNFQKWTVSRKYL